MVESNKGLGQLAHKQRVEMASSSVPDDHTNDQRMEEEEQESK